MILALSRNIVLLVLLFSKYQFGTIEAVFVYVKICVVILSIAQQGLGEISGSGTRKTKQGPSVSPCPGTDKSPILVL